MGDRRRSANGHHKVEQNKAEQNKVEHKKAAQEKAAHTSLPLQPAVSANGEATLRPIHNICVYCGSSPGRNPAYAQAARDLGRLMAENGIGLVYGGGGLGLMGEVAHSVLCHGGRVTGIIPEFLSEREQMLLDVTELKVVADMHQRKKMMFDRSDAFVALPGGIGTLEELVEQLTWAQLGRHSKPIVLFNVEDFWAPFLGLLDHLRREAFIRAGMDVRCASADSAEAVLAAIRVSVDLSPPGANAAVAEKF